MVLRSIVRCMRRLMAIKWLSSEDIYRVERAVAERAVAELTALDDRWHAEVSDLGVPGTVTIATYFDFDEQGPTARVDMDMLPQLWADALHQMFIHPSREKARRDRKLQASEHANDAGGTLTMTLTHVQTRQGDLFSSDAQTLVNAVNCVGVMGKGIALQFKRRFPEMFEDYADRCRSRKMVLGEPYLWRPSDGTTPWVLNFPTKGYWRDATEETDVLEGISYLATHYHEWEITSLAVPALGCGAGGLGWNAFRDHLVAAFEPFDIPVDIYSPWG